MNGLRNNSLPRFLLGSVIIAIIWSIASHVLSLWMATAADNLDMTASVPPALTFAYNVAFFPVKCFVQWDHAPSGFSERAFYRLIQLETILNSLLWGMFLSLLLFTIRNFLRRNDKSLAENAP